MSETLQRYCVEGTGSASTATIVPTAAIFKHPEGQLVLFTDAQRRIEELEGALRRLLNAVDYHQQMQTTISYAAEARRRLQSAADTARAVLRK